MYLLTSTRCSVQLPQVQYSTVQYTKGICIASKYTLQWAIEWSAKQKTDHNKPHLSVFYTYIYIHIYIYVRLFFGSPSGVATASEWLFIIVLKNDIMVKNSEYFNGMILIFWSVLDIYLKERHADTTPPSLKYTMYPGYKQCLPTTFPVIS